MALQLVNFPKTQLPGQPTGNRNLYVNPASVQLVFSDTDKPSLTAIVVGGEVVQYVEETLENVLTALKVNAKEELPTGLKEIPTQEKKK